MTDKELTTSKNIPTGQKIELTPEQKADNREKDLASVEHFKVQIDEKELSISNIKKALELNLPNRQLLSQLTAFEFELKNFNKTKEILEERIKKNE